MVLKQSTCRGDRKSTEVREAVSPCHEQHVNPAHGRQVEKWGAPALNLSIYLEAAMTRDTSLNLSVPQFPQVYNRIRGVPAPDG